MSMHTIGLGVILIFMFIALVREWLPAEVTVFLALSSLILTNILSPAEALTGFANTSVHTVANLFILGAAVAKTRLLHGVVERLLLGTHSISNTLIRIMLPTGVISAFLNNTPIVAILLPTIQKWAVSKEINPSKLLIPLSYAAIMGGTITLIGTSTNLLIQGLMVEKGLLGFQMFDFAYFGIPIMFAGIIYFSIIGHRFLPNRKQNITMFKEEKHLFLHYYKVENHSPIIGKTITEAMLRNLNYLYLIEIIRGQEIKAPVDQEEKIISEDILVFSGNPNGILTADKYLGLRKCSSSEISKLSTSETTLYEVTIPSSSSLIDKRIKDIHFRSKYHAVILGVKRKGNVISSGVGNEVVRQGDTLILLANKKFPTIWGDSDDFYLMAPSTKDKSKRMREKRILIGILLFILFMAIFQILPIYKLALLSTTLLILTNMINIAEALKSINWKVIILMGSSIGIGKAVESTGLAYYISLLLLKLENIFGFIGILILYYLLTTLLTEVLNNLATAALMFPIGFALSDALALDPMIFAMITAIAASCSFLTPIGYQTNMLVYGPGGYKFTDFIKAGFPLSIICMLLTVFLACMKWLNT